MFCSRVVSTTRGRLARKHFSPGAHPAAETPFYIAAASVSARVNVYGHMRAPSHHPSFLSNCAARFLTKVVCASCVVPGCCAQVALCKLLHASALCKLLCASCFVQAALRKCSATVAPRKRFAHVLCASCSVQVALRQLLRASALRMCSARRLLCASALSKLLCASALRQLLRASALRMCSVQVGLCKLLCASVLCNCSVQLAERKLLCTSAAEAVGMYFAYYFCT